MDPLIPRELHHRPLPARPPDTLRRSLWPVALPAAIAAALACPAATWWCVGDLSTVPLSADPDYAFRPLAVSPAVERMAGAGATALAAASLIILVILTIRRRMAGQWWWVLGPLLCAGLIGGAGWRVMTAGVIGANFGAGFVLLAGPPAVIGLLLWAAGAASSLARRPRQ